MHLKNFINITNLKKSFKKYKNAIPFDHSICDNFFKDDFAELLTKEFPSYDDDIWHEYDNPIEIKKTCNNWNSFKKNTYTAFSLLNSQEFINILANLTKINFLYPDHGLNGGGLHIHRKGGKLNYHLDYDIHPKIYKQRKINMLIYLTPNWKGNYGGELGFFSHDKKNNQPKELIKKIIPMYNRAVFFDTTQNSWHGLINKVNPKKNLCRTSIAIYYLTNPSRNVTNRSKALFAPTKIQKKNRKIINFIKKRACAEKSQKQYINKI
jgi:Rps23 Pro-64 3,4-dihydroxylase Tpa1-like proline 4-hydroxylase